MRALAIDGSAGGLRLNDSLPLANEIARLSGATTAEGRRLEGAAWERSVESRRTAHPLACPALGDVTPQGEC